MAANLSVVREIEQAIASGSSQRQTAILRRITDLFIVEAERYSDAEIAFFDDIFMRLVQEIETSARALLAERLAPLAKAPRKILRTLAFDDAIEVAQPV